MARTPCADCNLDLMVEVVQKSEDPTKLAVLLKAVQTRLQELAHRDDMGAGIGTRDVARTYKVKIPGYEGPSP